MVLMGSFSLGNIRATYRFVGQVLNGPMEGDVVAVVYLSFFPKGIEQIGKMAGASVLLQEVSNEGFQ